MTEQYKIIEVKLTPKQKQTLETKAKVEDIVKNLKEVDFLDLNLYPTSFAQSLKEKAWIALVWIGDHDHHEQSVFYIRPRTRFILDQLGISYKRLEGGEENE